MHMSGVASCTSCVSERSWSGRRHDHVRVLILFHVAAGGGGSLGANSCRGRRQDQSAMLQEVGVFWQALLRTIV